MPIADEALQDPKNRFIAVAGDAKLGQAIAALESVGGQAWWHLVVQRDDGSWATARFNELGALLASIVLAMPAAGRPFVQVIAGLLPIAVSAAALLRPAAPLLLRGRTGRPQHLRETFFALCRRNSRQVGFDLTPPAQRHVALQHLEFFVKLVQEAEPKLRGPEEVVWLNRLEHDLDNLRGALEWSLRYEGADQDYVGGKWIEISYGGPIKRGRDLWGSGPTYGRMLNNGAPVWRAGANAATTLTTMLSGFGPALALTTSESQEALQEHREAIAYAHEICDCPSTDGAEC